MKATVSFYNACGNTYVDSEGRCWNDKCQPSGQWYLTGVVEYGRGYTAGQVVARYTLSDVLAGRVPWFYKNGKQRCYPTDVDHGTSRVWMSPTLTSVRNMPK